MKKSLIVLVALLAVFCSVACAAPTPSPTPRYTLPTPTPTGTLNLLPETTPTVSPNA